MNRCSPNHHVALRVIRFESIDIVWCDDCDFITTLPAAAIVTADDIADRGDGIRRDPASPAPAVLEHFRGNGGR